MHCFLVLEACDGTGDDKWQQSWNTQSQNRLYHICPTRPTFWLHSSYFISTKGPVLYNRLRIAHRPTRLTHSYHIECTYRSLKMYELLSTSLCQISIYLFNPNILLLLYFRSTLRQSRPNKASFSQMSVRTFVVPSVHKKFLRFQWNLACR